MELITGATGYIGGRLLERLVAEGRPARALARNPSRLDGPLGVAVVRGDLLTGAGLEEALDGVETAYYLVHSMESADDEDFAARDRLAARNFVDAAQAAGVRRAVYLGGLMPARGIAASPHLSSRVEVEEILLEGLPESTALRASIVIGANSASFRLLVRLVERLRFLPMPGWRDNRTQPIDERDIVEYLARTPATPAAAGRSLDAVGPDILTYGEMIERIADHMLVDRSSVRLDVTLNRAASAVVSAVTEQPLELVRPLMESLGHELMPRDDSAREVYGLRLHGFDRAVENAMRVWERTEELAAR